MNERLDKPGLLYGAGAYLMWGLFPLLMAALKPASALEITANRAVWSLVVCLIFVAFMRSWRQLRVALSNRRVVLTLAAAGGFVAVNWLLYVYAIVSDHVNSASLGYYINPLFTVALGVIVLGERLRRLQMVAIAIGLLAVIVIGVGLGEFPWISLALATSFGIYGLIKKRVGAEVDAVTGLTVETMVLFPVAVIGLWIMAANDGLTFGQRGAEGLGLSHDLLMVSTGLFTAGALILFAAGARRQPLYVTGLLQYIAPTMMFILAVWHFNEPMPPSRWAGFALIWVALIVLTVDGFRSQSRRKIPKTAPVGAVAEPL
ncbi:EamA family transporter RarD [Demequina aurantiaca]|uniref:EamA family transporter RarD n=1 Tax=Demequina aurantiaca TaxID=676200 RepID=UPI000782D6A4|nr:EamA family transporter RarD [Demequina aurantiaca]